MATEPIAAPQPTRRLLGFAWPGYVSSAERRALLAGGLGWMLDAMDVMLYSMVLAHLLRDFGMEKDTAGLLNSDRKSTRLNSSHIQKSRMPSSA